MKKILTIAIALAMVACEKQHTGVANIENIGINDIEVVLNGVPREMINRNYYYNEGLAWDLVVYCKGDCKYKHKGKVYYRTTKLK